tara:strand:- start:517 stop:1254 length:738 start_codon:yes stop_codon:yes gene_type:complete
MKNRNTGEFYGFGVGPGEAGLLPLIAAEKLKECDLIFSPKASNTKTSTARTYIAHLNIPSERFHEVDFLMDNDRTVLTDHYAELAKGISEALFESKTVGYITIGDPFIFSTYSYTLNALLEIIPDLTHRTFPGISSFQAVASACSWPLGEGKERILILPCPDDMNELEKEIQTHDIVILMKIGKRYEKVRHLISKLNIEENCCLGHRVGTSDESIFNGSLPEEKTFGYFTTMLIRAEKQIIRHKQ